MRLPAGAAVTSRIGEGCGTPTEPATLQLDADTPVPAIGWGGPLGGHHVAGTRALTQRTRSARSRHDKGRRSKVVAAVAAVRRSIGDAGSDTGVEL